MPLIDTSLQTTLVLFDGYSTLPLESGKTMYPARPRN